MRSLLVLILLVVGVSVYSQDADNRYTESEIAVQDKYVEAKKYSLIGRFEKAEEILTTLYKEDRTNAAVAMELSKIYGYLEDPYNEHKFALKASENASKNEYVLANYAAICLDQEKFSEALPILTKLVNLQSQNEEYADKLATAHLQLNDSKSALGVYNALESRIGITENVSRRKYEIYEILGKEKEALGELKKLSDANPYEIGFMHNLASYYTKLGKEKEALAIYQKVLEVDINDAKANMAITTANSGGGNDNNYLRSLTPVIENASIPVDRKVLELVPYVDQLNNKYEKELADALTMLSERIAAIHPTEAKAYAIKGDILMASNNTKGAIKAYEKTISLNDNVYSVWEGLLEAYTELKDYPNLKKRAIEALDLFPNKPSAYMYYGRAHTLSNDATEAIDLLQEGLLVSGKDLYSKSNIYAELGRAFDAKGNTERALESIKNSLDISKSQNGLAYEIEGDIYSKSGKSDKALESWKKAQKLGMKSLTLQKKIENRKL